MQLKQLTPESIKDKVVVVRADYNVPLKNGEVVDDTRIVQSMPTLQFLIQNGARRVHILSHLGRPKGEFTDEYSLRQILGNVEKLLGEQVEFRDDFTAGEGRVQLHENTRFWAGEKKNDPNFVRQLHDGLEAEVFVLDGFSVAHRAHASVVGFAEQGVPSYPGRLIEAEIEHLSPFLSDEKISGLTVLIGGAKMETKVQILKHFARTADNIVVGGALANTFLVAQGFEVGQSLFEDEQVPIAREVIERCAEHKTGLHLPIDVECSDDPDSGKSLYFPLEDLDQNVKIFDIGPRTISSFREILSHSHTIIWNGPVGLTEKIPFETGTRDLAETIVAVPECHTILGGGDTVSAVKNLGFKLDQFTHVSTGGGAMLEFLEGKELPGIKILEA